MFGKSNKKNPEELREKCRKDNEDGRLMCRWEDPETGDKVAEVEAVEVPDGSPDILAHQVDQVPDNYKEYFKKRTVEQLPDNSNPLDGHRE